MGQSATFHIADPALVLAFCLWSVRPAGFRCEPPVACKGSKGGVDQQLDRSGVVERDQRLGVVDHHLLRHTVPGADRFL